MTTMTQCTKVQSAPEKNHSPTLNSEHFFCHYTPLHSELEQTIFEHETTIIFKEFSLDWSLIETLKQFYSILIIDHEI